VIIGSESDGPRPGARETRPEWVLDLVDQCDAAGVPTFVKQFAIDGELCSLPLIRGRVRADFPEVSRA
jgi:protein gp37